MNRITTNRPALLLLLCTAFQLVLNPPASAENNAASVARVGEDIRYLASDELEGRGPATEGLQKAADYIRDRFQDLGLEAVDEDADFQRQFDIKVDSKVVPEKTSLVLRGPEGQELKLELGQDFQPLAVGGAGKVKADVVFAGYGISAPKFNYDDYKDADVAGKVLLVIRREPQQGDPKSVFNGEQVSPHATIRVKMQAAKKNKAAAILLVNDPFTTKEKQKDELVRAGGFGTGASGPLFAHVGQAMVDRMLAASSLKAGDDKLASVEAVETKIDKDLTPLTQPLEGWTAELDFTFDRPTTEVANVIGVIEGEGPLADETVVIGAHYDHLGYGPFGSRRPSERAVHNGADDNASGTAAVLELARRFAQRDTKPARRLLFIAFTAEERGLVGSNKYLERPLFELANTVAMINFDMIGSLGDGGLLLGGVKSAKEFPGLLEDLGEDGELKVKPMNTLGGSDHAGFYRKGIPVLFFFTGMNSRYHTPDDDFELINVEGVVQTIDFAERALDAVLSMPERPKYVKMGRPARPGGAGAMSYLGVVPDYGSEDGSGSRITDVNADSPAGKGGLKAGDVIIKFGDVEIAGVRDLATGLRKYKPGQKVKVTVRRGDAERTFDVTLGEPRQR